MLIELGVRDVERSRAFYESLGFVVDPFVSGPDHVRCKFHGQEVALSPGGSSPGSGLRLWFAVPDVVSHRVRVDRADGRPGAIERLPSGWYAFDAQDPDGYQLRFVSLPGH